MSRHFVYFIGVVFFCSNLSAQNRDTLEGVEVIASKVITPSKTYKVEAIRAKEIEVNSLQNLSELLSKETNLYLKNYGMGGLSTLSIRGAGADKTKLLWNGIEVNSPTLGLLDLTLVPIGFVDEAEVHYGSASIINGSGGLGGSIQLNTRANYGVGGKGTFVKELGSFGMEKTLLSAKIGNQRFHSSTALFKNKSENNFVFIDISKPESPITIRENSGLLQYGLKQEFYFKPSQNQEIALKANYIDSDREIPSVLGVSSNGEAQKDKNLRVMGEWKLLSDKSFHQAKLAFIEDDLLYEIETAGISSAIITNAFVGIYNFKYSFSETIFIKVAATGNRNVAMSSGFDETKSENRGAVYLHFEHQTRKKLLYNFAVRQEFVDQQSIPFIPTVGLRYILDQKEKWVVNFNASRNYKYPTLNDRYWNPGGNQNLKPEEGYSTEGGLAYCEKKTTFKVIPYYSIVDDWIQWLPTNSGYWSPINLKQVQSYGFELSGWKELVKTNLYNSTVKVGYQYTNTTSLQSDIENDKSIGKQLIYVPRNKFFLSVNARYKKLEFSYAQTITGKVYVDAENSTYMPYYAPADVSVSYHIGQKLIGSTLSFKINNLYNEDYQIIANQPMPGRWFSFGVNLSLNKYAN